MPTKPAESITLWSSNANHLFGDYPGDATKVSPGAGIIAAGLIPGDPAPPTAEELNYTWNLWTKWLEWLELGTSVGDADAHVVESASDGQINATRLVIINAAGNSGIDSTGDGDDGVTGRSDVTGVRGISTAGTSPAVSGAHAAGGPGVRGTSVTGRGGYFIGGGVSEGVRGDGGAGGAPGATFNGTGAEPDIYLSPSGNFGIVIDAGAASFGGMAITADEALAFNATQADPDWGVMALYGASGAAALVPTLDVYASGDGNAVCASNISGTGYALRLRPKSAAPTRGALFCSGQAARPTDITRGQFTYLSTEQQWAHSEFGDFGAGAGAGWRGFLSTIGGSALGYGEVPGVAASGAINAWVNSVLCSSSGGDAPKIAGRSVLMRITLLARSNTANAAARLSLELLDVTDGNNQVFLLSGSNGIVLPDPGAVPASFGLTPVSLQVLVPVPLAGDRLWRLRFATSLNSLIVTRAIVAFGPGMQ